MIWLNVYGAKNQVFEVFLTNCKELDLDPISYTVESVIWGPDPDEEGVSTIGMLNDDQDCSNAHALQNCYDDLFCSSDGCHQCDGNHFLVPGEGCDTSADTSFIFIPPIQTDRV